MQEWSEPFELAGGHPRKRDIPERASDSGGFSATLPFPFTSIAKCVRDDLLGVMDCPTGIAPVSPHGASTSVLWAARAAPGASEAEAKG